MKSLSVKSQILLLIVAVVVIVAGSLVTLTTHQLKSSLHGDLERKAISISSIIAENAGPGLEFQDLDYVRDIVHGAFADNDVLEIHVNDMNGNRIFDNSSDNIHFIPHGYSTNIDSLIVAHIPGGCVVGRPIAFRGATVGTIWLGVSQANVDQNIRSNVETILMMTCIVLLIVFLASSLLSQKIVQPLKTFETAADRISAGDMMTAINVPTIHRDFVPLGRAFNNMQEALRSAFGRLNEAQEHLEAQVAARTRDLQKELAERQRAEEALRASEARYRTLFDSATAAIFIVDNYRFIDCNPCTLRMFGCTRSQILARPPYEFSPPFQPNGRNSKEAALEKMNAVMAGDPQFFEWQHCRLDGTVFDAEVGLALMEVSGQELIMAIVWDITARKQAEAHERELQDQLERAQRMESLAILAGGVAHDLNNTLGPLVGYPELMLMKLPEDSPLRRPIQRIGRAAEDAASVIQDLLSLARRGRYDMEPTDLKTVVEEYLDSPGFTRLTAARPDVVIETSLPDGAVMITGSSPHLTKVVMNLIVNACDAMMQGGKLTIELYRENIDTLLGGHTDIVPGEYAILKIRDNGTGISPDDLDRIFEPYYSKKKMGTSGSGLGLAVVYGIVRDHKGYYDIFSEKNKGTEFILYFPVTMAEADSGNEIRGAISGSESILVVDDVEDQREIARDMLTELGYRVQTMPNGRAAIDYLKDHSADLILLDMIMEDDLDGHDTYLKILELHPGQKAVIASGYSQTERVDKVLALGAGQYIKKPYTLQTIGMAVRSELDKGHVPIKA